MQPDSTNLEVDNVACVRGDRRLFTDMSFTLEQGSWVQLTGPNGSGKTSLLRIICGLMEPEGGEVRWQGANIRTLGEEYFTAITYVGHRNGVKDELTSIENLRISSGLTGSDVSTAEARDALGRIGLAGRENLAARLLSEGQRRRLALARLVICRKAVWVLDEVLTSLDKAAVGLMTSLIEEHLDKGGMAIIATHQEMAISARSFQRVELAL
jgi:heme exporter protein A